jgi:hypothetical protein
VSKLPPELQYLKEHGIARKVGISVMATVLLSLGGLSACAQPPPSTQTQSEISGPAEQEGARAAEAADAAAIGSGSNDASKGTVPVTTETMPQKVVGPPVASTLLEERILRFVDGIRSAPDMTRSRLEEVMQVRLEQDSELQGWWWYIGASDEKWQYTLKVDERSKDDSLPLITISFSAGDVEGNARTTVCTYELEAFARSLVALGYTRHPGWKQPGGHLVFSREQAGTRFGSTVKVRKYVQQIGTGEDDFQYCVYTISISAGELLDGE